MNQYLLLLILMTTQLFSIENIKYKVKQNNEVSKVKFYIENPMTGEEKAKKNNRKPEYITRIIIEAKQQIIYDILTSPNISKNPMFKFHFNSKFYSDTMKLTTVNNKNKKVHKELAKDSMHNKWKISDSTIDHEYSLLDKDIWSITNMNEAIKMFSKNEKFIYEENIKVTLPKLASDMSSVPMRITSSLKLESIAIFQDKNKYSTVAIIKNPTYSLVDYSLRLNMNFGCDINIVVIAKGKDGKVYRKDSLLTGLASDMNCDSTSNGGGG